MKGLALHVFISGGADLELVTRDGDDEHPEEDRLHGEEDAVQDPGLLQSDVLSGNGK